MICIYCYIQCSYRVYNRGSKKEYVCIDAFGSQQFNLIKDPQRNDFISEQEGSPLTPVSLPSSCQSQYGRISSESALNITNACKVNMGNHAEIETIINPVFHLVC